MGPENRASKDGGTTLWRDPKLAALAARLEAAASKLADGLVASLEQGAQPAGDTVVAEVKSVCAGLRAAALRFASNLAEAATEHERTLKSVVGEVDGNMRAGAEANERMAESMSGQVAELDIIAKLPPGDELAERLVNALAAARQTTSEISENVAAMARGIEEADERITTLDLTIAQERERSEIDWLTRVCSRLVLDERLETALGAEDPWCFAIVDIDRFHDLNVRYGCVVGDGVLFKLARAIEEAVATCPAPCTIARYGGEEFGIILPGVARREAGLMAEALRRRIAAARWEVRAREVAPVQMTVSIGVAQHRKGDTAGALMDRAAKALGRAKSEGRNQVVLADD